MRIRVHLGITAIVVAGTVGLVAGPAAASPAPAGPAAATGPASVTAPAASGYLANTVALSNCSASLVRFPSSVDTDRALMLTNGHCYEGGMPAAGQVIVNRSSSRSGRLLGASGYGVGTVRADRVLYATMTGTDVTLYELTDTYGRLKSRYRATALTIAAAHPADATTVAIPSSYWRQVWNCSVNGFVGTLREGSWTWHDSVRYNAACNPTHGTSGSPIIDTATGAIVGINNTGNDNGQMCTLNNPCEVNPDGTTTAKQGQSYGQETYWFTTCLSPARTIDLSVSGCLLTKPTAAAAAA